MSSPGQACLILWHQALLHMFRPFAIVVKWKMQRMPNLSSNNLSQHYLGLAAHAILQSIKQLSCCNVQAQHCRAIQIQHHGTSIAKARIWPWCSRRNYPWPMAIILLKSLSFVFSTLAHWPLVAWRNRLEKHPLTLTGQHLDQSWSKAWPWFRVKRRMVFFRPSSLSLWPYEYQSWQNSLRPRTIRLNRHPLEKLWQHKAKSKGLIISSWSSRVSYALDLSSQQRQHGHTRTLSFENCVKTQKPLTSGALSVRLDCLAKRLWSTLAMLNSEFCRELSVAKLLDAASRGSATLRKLTTCQIEDLPRSWWCRPMPEIPRHRRHRSKLELVWRWQ